MATGTIFNAFGMARPGIEPKTSRCRSGRSTICAIGTGISCLMEKIPEFKIQNSMEKKENYLEEFPVEMLEKNEL